MTQREFIEPVQKTPGSENATLPNRFRKSDHFLRPLPNRTALYPLWG